MGYELWISPNTGIRRKGTTFKEIQSIFIDNITTKYIYEPIYSCRLIDECHFVKEALTFRDFDVAGVIDNNTKIVGYVTKLELIDGLIETHCKKIESHQLIPDSTPITSLMKILTETPFAFVSVEDEIEGIVTRADINKPIVRIYLFGIISLFELHLYFWINEYHNNESWKSCIKEERLKSAERIFEKRKGKNEELSILECLEYCDKRDILSVTREFIERFKFSRGSFERLLNRMEIIRNELAHSQTSITSNLEWDEFYQTISNAEAFLHTSEKIVEEKVSESFQ
ncbi:MAG: CBS domain-containing protein [Bacteroidia bacterium]